MTGGIASGKSTVANLFTELGVAVVDTDIIARELVEPGQPALGEIRDRFGDSVINTDGSLNRRRLRKIVFENVTARLDLEAILHPRIGEETRRQANAANGPYLLIVVPLLVTSKLIEFVDRILVVDCPEDTQILRLLQRDSETVEQARQIIAVQTSREDRISLADDVLRNDSSVAELRVDVSRLDRQYRRLAAQRARPEPSPETR